MLGSASNFSVRSRIFLSFSKHSFDVNLCHSLCSQALSDLVAILDCLLSEVEESCFARGQE